MSIISLVGPIGSGKTSVGLRLAKLLNYDYHDTDKEIEKRCGVDIAWIFSVESEPGFRKRESTVLESLLQKQQIVLATGGGLVLQGANRERLMAHTTVIYLKVGLEQQTERVLRRSSRRPLLQTDDPAELSKKLTDLNRVREPYYHQVADIVLETDEYNHAQIANMIINQL